MKKIVDMRIAALFFIMLSALALSSPQISIGAENRYNSRSLAKLEDLAGKIEKLYGQKKYSQAEQLAKDALQIAQKVYGQNDKAMTKYLDFLGNIYFVKQEFNEAEPFSRQSLDINKFNFPADSPEVINSKKWLAAICIYRGKYGESKSLLEEILPVEEKMLGKNHPNVLATRKGIEKINNILQPPQYANTNNAKSFIDTVKLKFKMLTPANKVLVICVLLYIILLALGGIVLTFTVESPKVFKGAATNAGDGKNKQQAKDPMNDTNYDPGKDKLPNNPFTSGEEYVSVEDSDEDEEDDDSTDDSDEADSPGGGFKKFEKDEVYEEAVKLIFESYEASVTVLQRRLGLGYTRAARLIDMMEDEGIVGPYQGSKPRDILMSLEEYNTHGASPKHNDDAFSSKHKKKKKTDSYKSYKSSYSSNGTHAESHYEILGISENASIEEIKKAYRKKIMEYHPDKTGGLGEKLKNMATEEAKKINCAFAEIMKSRGVAP